MTTKTHGVTLLEMAIVLAIIGLLMAGIVVGATMERSAELQKIGSNFLKFQSATKQFYDKYKYFPGDMPNATDFWGTGICDNTPETTRDITTCNGNADGKVESWGDLIYLQNPSESVYFWQHLTNSKFLEGTYSGRYGTGSNLWKPGYNIPKGHDVDVGYTFYYTVKEPSKLAFSIPTSDPSMSIGVTFPHPESHVITYGGLTDDDGTDHPPVVGTLSAQDAMFIDQKIDDGHPALGNLLSNYIVIGADPFCTTDAVNPADTVFELSVEKEYCTLFFMTGLK